MKCIAGGLEKWQSGTCEKFLFGDILQENQTQILCPKHLQTVLLRTEALISRHNT